MTRLKVPPLALDLHYLLTAYGYADYQAEALLGYALIMLHENPVIARDDIKYALNNLSNADLPNLPAAVAECGLADQVEMIKITPSPLGREEMAWLWTALKADYRPTFPFQVSVVLMRSPLTTSMAWPVLRRHLQVLSQTPPQIATITLPINQPVALPGNPVTVTGVGLGVFNRVALVNADLGVNMPADASVTNSTTLTFSVPNDAVNFPAGLYTLTAQAYDATSKIVTQSSNGLPFAVAPSIPPQTASTATNATGVVVTVNVSPNVWESQNVLLSLNDPTTFASVTASSLPFTPTQQIAGSIASVSFQFGPTLPADPQIAVLQVDGVSSLVDTTGTPPAFSGPLVTIP